MKYFLQPLALVSCAFLVNCSSIPEIEPYQQKKELTIEDVREASGFYKDNEFDDDAPTPLADVDNGPAAAPTNDPIDEPIDEPVVKSESIEKSKAVKEPKVPMMARQQASAFKNGMHVFAQNCAMKTKPDSSSADAGSVQAGKKLWLDSHNGDWLKAYKKTGTVYVPADCVN